MFQTPKLPALNWREIESIAQSLNEQLVGCSLDRIFVPIRTLHPLGYNRNEWNLRFKTPSGTEKNLLLVLRSQQAGLGLYQRHARASQQASHSVFDLQIRKLLSGLRVQSIEPIQNDRWIDIHFVTHIEKQYSLSIFLMPATPEAILWDRSSSLIVARSRTNRPIDIPFIRDPRIAPAGKYDIRANTDHYGDFLDQNIDLELMQNRLQFHQKKIQTTRSALIDRINALQIQIQKSENEPNYKLWTELFQVALHKNKTISKETVKIDNYYDQTTIEIPTFGQDKGSALLEILVAKYKRKQKRREEALRRIADTTLALKNIESLLTDLIEKFGKADLEAASKIIDWEKTNQLEVDQAKGVNQNSIISPGRKFLSIDKQSITIGRDLKENHELTFQWARPHDLWLHLRGQPSAHGIIRLEKKQSASLQTLIDSGHLLAQYSGLRNWSKIELDYTERRYVRKIRGSTQVNFQRERTLTIAFEEERLERLMKT